MPLPTPRSVTNSANHMMSPVPAVSVMIMSSCAHHASLVRRLLHDAIEVVPKSWPDRATVTRVVDCRSASAIVRYRVYCVSLAWPACPSLYSVSKCGMTTRSSCTMIVAVMYGMTPSAKIDSCSRAPPENRLTRESSPSLAEPVC